MEIPNIITFSITQKPKKSSESMIISSKECHHLISHTNVSGTRLNKKSILSIDKVKHTESKLRKLKALIPMKQ
jgi:hypothetical protein